MSSRVVGTWPQSFISDGGLRPIEWILNKMAECPEDLMETQKTMKGIQNTWKGKLAKGMSEYESGDRSEGGIFRLENLHDVQLPKY